MSFKKELPKWLKEGLENKKKNEVKK